MPHVAPPRQVRRTQKQTFIESYDGRNPHHHSNPTQSPPEIRTIPRSRTHDIVYRTSHEQIKDQPPPLIIYDAYGKCRQISFASQGRGRPAAIPSSCFHAPKRRWAYLPPSDGRRGKRRGAAGGACQWQGEQGGIKSVTPLLRQHAGGEEIFSGDTSLVLVWLVSVAHPAPTRLN